MENYLSTITNYLLTQSWQIAALVAAIAAVNLALKNRSAHVRYLLWLIVLAKCLVPPLVTIPLAILPQDKMPEPTLISSGEMPAVNIEMAETITSEPIALPSLPVTSPTIMERLARVTARQWLGFGWIVGVAAFLFFALVKALRTDFWLWRQRKLLPDELQTGIENLFSGLGIKTLPKVWLVEGIGQPFVWGLLRGSIYLPADFVKIDSAEHRRGILGHEISHILRFDAAVNILQIIAQAVFWFHPFVWWANKKNRAEREKCCDEMAIARLGAKAKDYSSAIVETLITEYESTRPVPSLAVAGPVRNIEERIKTMLRPGKKFYKRPSLVAATVVLLLALLTVPTALVLTTRAGTQTETTGPARGEAVAVSRARKQPALATRRVWERTPDVGGAPSPDGRYLSFVDWDTGDLAVRDLRTGKNRRVTNKESGWSNPSGEHAQVAIFSPDSKQLAYNWYSEGAYELRTIGMDGSDPQILNRTKEFFSVEPRDWSGDGQSILVLIRGKRDGDNKIGLVSVKDGSARSLKELGGSRPRMKLSPDGRYVVYDFPAEEGSTKRDIFLLAIDGSGENVLVDHPADDYLLGWAPDDRGILFASNRRDTRDIWSLAIADGKPQGKPELVKTDIGTVWSQGFTRNGSWYYSVWVSGTNVYIATFDPKKAQVVGTPVLATRRREDSNRVPDWSPDGKYLAYMSSTNDLLSIQSLETGEQREYPVKGLKVVALRWHPDARSILVSGFDRENRRRGYLIDVQTGEAITSLTGRVVFGVWSPDGKAIFYGLGTRTIMRRDLETGQDEEIHQWEGRDLLRALVISPDGQQLAFVDGPHRLMVMSAAGGEVRELVRLGPTEWLSKGPDFPVTWSPDGRYVLFVKRFEKSVGPVPRAKLWRVPAEGGEPQKLGLATQRGGVRHLCVHPDGKRIAFTSGHGRFEVWALENFLPAAVASAKTK